QVPDRLHRLGKRPHAGQHHGVSRAHGVVIARHLHGRPDVLERHPRRREVAHPVVEDRDPHRSPLVDGTPVSVGSSAIASRSARANALMAASITWWSLPPASTRTCRVSFAVLATARRNSWQRPASKSCTGTTGNGPSNAANG